MIDLNTVEHIVPRIHEKGFFGEIYEMGAGVPIASNLFDYPGASKTIYATHSLYNKKSVYNHFDWDSYDSSNKKFDRSVSWQACQAILNGSKSKKRGVEVDLNFHLVSTFQLPEETGSTKHGWIGLSYKDKEKFYHLTFPSEMSRKQAIKAGGLDGCKILFSRNMLPLVDTYIDIVLDGDGSADYSRTLEALSSTDKNLATLIDPKTSNFQRLETLLRKPEPVIYKGSFNPWHEGHEYALNCAESENKAVCISINTYDKGHLDIHHLKNRLFNLIEDFNSRSNVPLIVTTKPSFKDFYSLCRDKISSDALTFVLGDDTLERVVRYNDIDLFYRKDIKVICLPRIDFKYDDPQANIIYIKDNPFKGLSSTLIRNNNNTK